MSRPADQEIPMQTPTAPAPTAHEAFAAQAAAHGLHTTYPAAPGATTKVYRVVSESTIITGTPTYTVGWTYDVAAAVDAVEALNVDAPHGARYVARTGTLLTWS